MRARLFDLEFDPAAGLLRPTHDWWLLPWFNHDYPYPPMKRFLLAPFLAALAMFFWGFIYYGLSGIPYKALGTAGDVGPALHALFPASGTYVLPDPRGTSETLAEQMKRGQLATVHINKSVSPEMDPTVLAKGFALEFVVSLLLALILNAAFGQQDVCISRFKTCLTIGLLTTLFANGGQAIWWQQAWDWHLMTMLHDLVCFALAGAVLTFFFRVKSAAKA